MRRLDHLNTHYTQELAESPLIFRGFLTDVGGGYIGSLPARGSRKHTHSRGDSP